MHCKRGGGVFFQRPRGFQGGVVKKPHPSTWGKGGLKNPKSLTTWFKDGLSVRNYEGVVSSHDKIFHVGPSTHTLGYGKFVNACYARFTNSNAKLRLRLRLHLDFLPSLRSGKKLAICPRAFIRPYIN